MRAMASPDGARRPNWEGKTVAKTTTTAVIAGKLPPEIPKCLVSKAPTLHIANDTAIPVAISSAGILFSVSEPLLVSASVQRATTTLENPETESIHDPFFKRNDATFRLYH